jgi:hypothetical protein
MQGVKAGEDIPEGALVQVPCSREGAVVRQGWRGGRRGVGGGRHGLTCRCLCRSIYTHRSTLGRW